MAECMEQFEIDSKIISDIGGKNLIQARENIKTDEDFRNAFFLHADGQLIEEL